MRLPEVLSQTTGKFILLLSLNIIGDDSSIHNGKHAVVYFANEKLLVDNTPRSKAFFLEEKDYSQSKITESKVDENRIIVRREKELKASQTATLTLNKFLNHTTIEGWQFEGSVHSVWRLVQNPHFVGQKNGGQNFRPTRNSQNSGPRTQINSCKL